MISSDDLLIFDLDGTLLQSTDFDDTFYKEAVTEITGVTHFRKDWNEYTHVTDSGLLREILSDAGMKFQPAIETDVKASFFSKVKTLVANGYEVKCLRGVEEMLSNITQSGARFGIATGGWECTARLKIEASGLPLPEYISSSDDAISRKDIMLHCLNQIGGSGVPVYFGDGEWDVRAAAELGWRFVGVGPSIKTKAPLWIEDFNKVNFVSALKKLNQA